MPRKGPWTKVQCRTHEPALPAACARYSGRVIRLRIEAAARWRLGCNQPAVVRGILQAPNYHDPVAVSALRIAGRPQQLAKDPSNEEHLVV
jgi:hypothetical protein